MAEVGDIFALPLTEGFFAIGQIGARNGKEAPSLMLIADGVFALTSVPPVPQLITLLSNPVIVVDSFDSSINSGDWRRLANVAPSLIEDKLPAYGVPMGLPWRLMFLVESYDRRRKRLARPWKMGSLWSRFSVSPKLLEQIVGNYLQKANRWDRKYDRVLYANCRRF